MVLKTKIKTYFESVDSRVSFPEQEEEVLKLWDQEDLQKKAQEKNKDGKKFVFYDGPPTANGKPHLGHVITRSFKDIYPRYKTMQGYYPVRKAGWDTHGLPVEVEVEKKLGISGKDQIENIVKGDKHASIVKFNKLCRESVWKYVDVWEKMVKRVGHWIDLKNPYITYDNDYIESVWWSLKTLFDKDLLYLDYKVVPFCTRCGTPLSSHEVSQDYKDVTQAANTYKYKLVGKQDTYFLAWSTTPWNKIVTPALALNPKLTYVKVSQGKEFYILAENTLKILKPKPEFKIVEKMKGDKLIGTKFEGHYDFYPVEEGKKAFEVIPGDFVSDDEGTGIVTIAAYGEDDLKIMRKNNIAVYLHVDEKGILSDDVPNWAGMHYLKVNNLVNKDLVERGLMYSQEQYTHRLAHCWRCHNPLMQFPLESWFIKTTKFKKELLANNKKTNWIPGNVGTGRMNDWYKTLIDWSLSRNRYWGAPLPIWKCEDCDHMRAVDKKSDLKKLALEKHNWDDFDLHRPYVDEVTIKCDKCDSTMRRTPEVIDVWYESGAMTFAQFHSPHENKKEFEENFPADFITEAIDQTRGWFYSLQAVNTLLFGKSPYKNVIVFQHVLDEKGKKMSKHIGNVVDPWDALEKHGADATRWLFFSSATIGTQYRVSIDSIGKVVRTFLLPLWNTYNFFITYAQLDKWKPKVDAYPTSKNILDKWIVARMAGLIDLATISLDKYNTFKSSRAIEEFLVKDLSQWHIRRSRERIGPSINPGEDKKDFYETTYWILLRLCELLAPFTPFVTDVIYRNLTKGKSVHLANWPTTKKLTTSQKKLLNDMLIVRKIVEKAHAIRKDKKIPVRQPLSLLRVLNLNSKLSSEILGLVKEEINVKDIKTFSEKGDLKVELDIKITPELAEEAKARELIRQIQSERRNLKMDLESNSKVASPWIPKDKKLIDWVKQKTLSTTLTKGSFKVTVAK